MSSIYRYIRALLNLLSFRVDKAREILESDPSYQEGKWNEVVNRDAVNVNNLTDAVAELVATRVEIKDRLKQVTAATEEVTNRKAGALKKLQMRVKQLRASGIFSKEEMEKDPEYVKHRAAFNDFASTHKARVEEMQHLDGRLSQLNNRIDGYKIRLQTQKRELENTKLTAKEAVADIRFANVEEKLNKALAGIAVDDTSKEKEKLLASRRRAIARSEVSSELAGTDTTVSDQEYEMAGATNEIDAELDAMLGISDAKTSAPAETETAKTSEKLP